ncbi:hypothetical protein VE03_05811 [Pseudogymnoascus sp. 23342-1-I1]|nr:hypothetical protein VE03_05811 [Pseudogymnoascus sp. 23342-1-I1]
MPTLNFVITIRGVPFIIAFGDVLTFCKVHVAFTAARAFVRQLSERRYNESLWVIMEIMLLVDQGALWPLIMWMSLEYQHNLKASFSTYQFCPIYSNDRDSLALPRPLDAISTSIQVMFAALIPYILIYILLMPYDALNRGLITPVAAVLFGIVTAAIVSVGAEYFRVGPFQSLCITLWVIKLAFHELI